MTGKPKGRRAMTGAERQRRHRARERAMSDAQRGRYDFDPEAVKDQGELIRKALAEMAVSPTDLAAYTVGADDLAALEPDEGPMIVTDVALIEFGARQKRDP